MSRLPNRRADISSSLGRLIVISTEDSLHASIHCLAPVDRKYRLFARVKLSVTVCSAAWRALLKMAMIDLQSALKHRSFATSALVRPAGLLARPPAVLVVCREPTSCRTNFHIARKRRWAGISTGAAFGLVTSFIDFGARRYEGKWHQKKKKLPPQLHSLGMAPTRPGLPAPLRAHVFLLGLLLSNMPTRGRSTSRSAPASSLIRTAAAQETAAVIRTARNGPGEHGYRIDLPSLIPAALFQAVIYW